MFQHLIKQCESGALLNPEEAILILNENLQGEELNRVFAEANRRTRAFGKNKGLLWTAVGVDSVPCSRNCKFCSHGAAWGIFNNPHELSTEEVLEHVSRLIPYKPGWITLRTTQDYAIDRLCRLVQEVRKVALIETEIAVNTGEFGIDEARKLKQAGVTVVYHTIRLREGIDTGLTIADRIATFQAVQAAGLKMSAGIEPLGPEHTDEEIVQAAFRLKPYNIRLSGVMARVPVPGTPLYDLGAVSEERQVRVVAMIRLIYGSEVDSICLHPPIAQALQAGANRVVVESGAIPRDQGLSESSWRGFSPVDAQKLLSDNGFI